MNESGSGDSLGRFFDLLSLDMQGILISEIKAFFKTLEPIELSEMSVDVLRRYEMDPDHARKGLYMLHHEGKVAYVGKIDRSLFERLSEHRQKLHARQHIDVRDVSFRCLYLDRNWSALAHESGIIEENRIEGGCTWNNGGFGLHDPGRERDTTRLKQEHFDRRFPINPDFEVNLAPETRLVSDVLGCTKRSLPYLLRFETSKRARRCYESTQVTLPANPTAKSMLAAVVDALGPAWQVSFLHGYAILYEESKDYGQASCQLFRRGGGVWRNPVP